MRTIVPLLLCVFTGCSCGSTTSNADGGTTPAPDAGAAPDAGTTTDGGTVADAGVAADAGTPDAGTAARTGTANLVGTVAGVTFVPQDAISSVDPANPNDALIEITEAPNACSDEEAGIARKNEHILRIVLRNQDGNGNAQPLVQGTYLVTASATQPGLTATVALASTDASCLLTSLATGTGGSVTMTEASPLPGLNMRGMFEIGFGSDSLTGSFSAPFCENPLSASSCQ